MFIAAISKIFRNGKFFTYFCKENVIFSTIKDFSKSGVISFIKLQIVPYFATLVS
jgi:hypothetical protein